MPHRHVCLAIYSGHLFYPNTVTAKRKVLIVLVCILKSRSLADLARKVFLKNKKEKVGLNWVYFDFNVSYAGSRINFFDTLP